MAATARDLTENDEERFCVVPLPLQLQNQRHPSSLILHYSSSSSITDPSSFTWLPHPSSCQLQSAHLETSVSLFSSQLLGTEVACRDLAPSLPSMKTDTLGKQDHCCGCWCPPSILAVLITSAELSLPEAVETVPVSSQIGSDGKSPTAYTCTAGD